MRRNHSRSTAPYSRPTYDSSSKLWFYGNAALLRADLAFVAFACSKGEWTREELKAVEAMAESLVLENKILVCGVHGEGHRRAATVPLKWGSPRIVVFSGGFRCHLGADLKDEPFREARFWRREWDPLTDLAVSRRSPEKPPFFASVNSAVDRLIARLAGPGAARFADGVPPPTEPDPVRRYWRVPAAR